MFRILRIIARYSSYPFLLLPVTRGPIHGFYHFFTGYFVPILAFKIKKPEASVAVIDSTPLNHWFHLLPGKPVEIVDSHRGLKMAYQGRRLGVARGYRVRAFTNWDKQTGFARNEFGSIADLSREFFKEMTNTTETRTPKILVFGREYTPPHYKKYLPSRYGTAKRNIPNLRDIVNELSDEFDLEYVDPAEINPLELIKKCQNASVAIGQHGAAISNAFFLPRGSRVIEIGWPELADPTHLNMFGLLCEQLGLSWSRPIMQKDKFAAISVKSFRRVLVENLELHAPPI